VELLDQGENAAVILGEQLFQVFAPLSLHPLLNDGTRVLEVARNLVVQIVAVGHRSVPRSGLRNT
jgi:hypothetical protein